MQSRTHKKQSFSNGIFRGCYRFLGNKQTRKFYHTGESVGDAGEIDSNWFQQLIAMGLSLGIGKRQLLEDYYFDEIFDIFGCRLNSENQTEKLVDAEGFFA